MKNFVRIIFCLIVLNFTTNSKAQLSGAYNVPATYTSIAAAINDLNTLGISGSVTINIAAGYTETAPNGGYTLTATGNSTASITFQKSGAGANPLITSYTTGVGTPGAAVQDGIWRLLGCDYITIDGIDLYDPNLTNNATMEFGYGLFKASTTNGSQYNTIRNCTITLNRINNGTGAGTVYHGSRGIDVCNALTGSQSTNVIPASAAGANSYNRFYSNTIQNCNTGISINGYAAPSPYTLADQSNDVGGTSSATGNTLINFGGGGVTNPCAGVRTRNQYNVNVSYNVVNNNNGSGVNHATTLRGIEIDLAPEANVTVLSNTVTMNGGGTTAVVNAIHNLAGSASTTNTVAMNNNLITNSTYSTATSGMFYGIWNESATPGYLQINGNRFINNSTGATSSGITSFYNNGAVTGMISMSNNTITGTNFTAPSTSGGLTCIMSTAAGTLCAIAINNNYMQGLSTNTITGTFQFVNLGIGGASLQLTGNILGSTTFSTTAGLTIFNNNCQCNSLVSNNAFSGTITKTGAGSTVIGYITQIATAGKSYTITGNNFSNVVLNNSAFYGIDSKAATTVMSTVNSNTISNITGAGGAGSAGIYNSGGGPGSTISNNLVSSFSLTAGLFHGIYNGVALGDGVSVSSNTVSNLYSTAASTVFGMYQGLGTNANFFKNKIYDLQANNAAGIVVGLGIPAPTANSTITAYNNLIGDLRAPITSNANAIIGINLNSTATNQLLNIYYNSVYINASSSGANFGTSGVNHTANAVATTGQLTLLNNIIVNPSTRNGTGLTVAFRRSAATLANYNTNSNTNIFYGGIPGAGNLLYYDGTNSMQTISSFKTLVTPREISSATEFPPFVSVVGSNANFLNLNTSTPTQAESAATPIAGITDDYIGTVRNVTTPDIGAWEGNYTPADLTAPAITAVAYTTPACNLSTRTLTANISDVSGVASGSLVPRCYYRVNLSAYTSVAGTLTSGTLNNGVWTFVLAYTAAVGDVISHYITAQDVTPSANITAIPSAGFAATDVNNIISPPNTPSTFTTTGTLNGLYTVGATGNFTTLTAAALAYNTWCITGPVTFELISTTYSTSTGETFPITFTNTPYASSTNSLLIRPATGVAATITGAAASAAVIKFLNAQYITMDGLNSGGSSLSITNGNTGTSADIWLASTTAVGPGCKNLEFNNLNLRGNSTTVASNYGIVADVDGATPATTAGMDNDNIRIMNNTFVRMGNAVYAAGTTSLSAGGLDNWTISTNTIGPAVVTTSLAISAAGVSLSGVVNGTVTNNSIRNIITTGSGIAAIDLSSNMNTVSVLQNTVNVITATGVTSGLNSICGLFLGSGTGVSVKQNIFSTISNTTTGSGVRGIIVSAATASANATFENNFIGDIYGYAGTTAATWPIGIAVEGASGNINFDNNSVSLSGSHAAGTGSTSAVAFYMNATTGNMRLRNNILSNTYDNSNSTVDRVYSIYSTVPAANFTAINYNDYYVGGSAASQILGYIAATNQMNLAAIQTSFGSNLNSQNITPVFTSASDLHLIPLNNAALDNLGTPLAGITVDIDNQVRNVTTPDIGADEFTAPPCSSANGGTQSTSTFPACSGQTLSLSSSGASAGAGIVYQWQVSPTSGGPYSNVSGGSGATTTTYTTGILSAGTYYYVMQATCASATLTGISNEATVTVNPNPTVTAVSSASILCTGSSATLTASGAVSYTWSTGTTSATTVESPTTTVNYTVTGVDANGCMNSTVITQSVSTCAGVSATLNDRAAFTVYPNPSSGHINIILGDGNTSANLEIMDAIGKVVMKQKLSKQESLIDISGLQSGMYFYVIKDDAKIMHEGKLVKE